MSPTKVEGSNKIGFGYFEGSTESLFLLACLICAFTIRLLLVPHESVINGDGAYYTILGERFVSGDLSGGISAYWSPLYSILTGTSSLFFHDREFAGRFVSLVAGALLIIPTYFLIRELFGRLPAIFGTILVVFHPFLIKASGWVMTESVYTLLFTTFVLSGWYALLKWRSQTFLATGVLLGAAFLVKPEAIGYLALVFLLVIAAKIARSEVSWRRCTVNCLILLGGFGLFFVPYAVYLHQKTGEWTLSQKIAVNFPAADYDGKFLGLSGDGKTTMKDRIWGDDYETEYVPSATTGTATERTSDGSHLWTDLTILGSKMLTLLKKQVRDYLPTILPFSFLFIALAGFFCRPWTRGRAAKETYLFSLVLCTLIGYAASAVELRYLFPLVPILLAWTAHGIVEFSEWVSRSLRFVFGRIWRIRPLIVSLSILILLLGSLVPLFGSVFKADDIANVPFEEKDAGLWIKAHADKPSPLVMSSHITPAFYAGAKHIYLPDEVVPTIIEYAKLRKIDYLVFSERRMRDAPLIFADQNSVPQGLELVYRNMNTPNYGILVFQLSP